MAEKSVKCSACGTTMTAESEEVLVKELQEHVHEHHDKDMPEAKAREAVERGHT